MDILGYARVSTSHQKLTHQISELKNAGVREERIFTDMNCRAACWLMPPPACPLPHWYRR
ncbi:recombinase family protein [Escherichia coli]|uniref:recombinase family protein n=1 Tax=Escherichia coli TaxID=562 RepID=UPI0039659E47